MQRIITALRGWGHTLELFRKSDKTQAIGKPAGQAGMSTTVTFRGYQYRLSIQTL